MATSVTGQRLHEMMLNPPTKIDGLLPLVSSFFPFFFFKIGQLSWFWFHDNKLINLVKFEFWAVVWYT